MDKKNILNKYILRTQIRERLEYRKECLEYIAIRLKHIEINDKVGKEFYQKKPIVSFILKLTLLKTFCKNRVLGEILRSTKTLILTFFKFFTFSQLSWNKRK